MWKKLQRPRNAPTHTSEDDASGRTGDGESNPTSQGPPQDTSPGLPPLPLSTEPESASQPRVASSIYSRPNTFIDTSGQGYDSHNPTARDSRYTDVSPPVSPLHGSQNNGEESSEVSPIDETPKTFDQPRYADAKPASSLPVPRKDVKPSKMGGGESGPASQKEPQARNKRTSGPPGGTKWDDFSGEPTTSAKGKAALATPGKLPQPTKQSTQKSQFNFLNKGRELNKAGKKFLETRRRHHDDDDPAKPPPQRQPWRGQSGRSAIVNPVQTKKEARVQPVTVPPRKDSKGLPRHQPTLSSSQTPASEPKAEEEEDTTPTVSPKGNASIASSKTPTETVRTVRSSSVDWSKHSKPLPTPHAESASEGNSKGEQNDGSLNANFGESNVEQQPGSRFSVTTYATTEAGSRPSSPKDPNTDKDVPPLPSVPKEALSRAAPSTRVAQRKPTPSEISTNVKSLPQSPEEQGAANRIDALNARLNDLARRRGNINTIINELTQVIQPSSIAYDMATRGEVKKTVSSLNDELAEIKKEEHDIGMKLMRAYKKRDQEDFYQEPSVLWIKRVAS